jgi:GH24 family phage-related lysozyme (muramidase)
MQGEVFRGDVKDVCAELKKEAQRCKGMTVNEWLRRRRIEKALAEQFGCSVEEVRKIIKIR